MKSLYLSVRFFLVICALVILFSLAFLFDFLLSITQFLTILAFLLLFLDIYLLYQTKGIRGKRATGEKLSNGDENEIFIYLENRYGFEVVLGIIDEIPFQFQRRDLYFETKLKPNKKKTLEYKLRPTERGEYSFGALNLYATSPIGFARRRFRYDQNQLLPVYPSFLQMRKYELLAISNRLTEEGIKKIRRIGHNREFEQIKEYVAGDDVRTINWKATARRNQLMVNHYQDEKSQQVYNVIDMGRVMKMPFEELSLLDYAINASLVLSNIALLKDDKAGLITFNEQMKSFLPARRNRTQMQSILETLYNQETTFQESNYESLYVTARRKINHRSLLIIYTNFETLGSVKRQMPFFQKLAQSHVLVVVFFENTELHQLLEEPAQNTEGIYIQTIAEKFAYEKRLIVKELNSHGIYAILTPPQKLTANTINQYLELKARGVI